MGPTMELDPERVIKECYDRKVREEGEVEGGRLDLTEVVQVGCSH